MGLYEPDGSKILLPQRGFMVDANNLELIVDQVKIGSIIHLPPEITKKIATGLSTNPNAMYFAASGVPISYDYGGAFRHGQNLLAVEMVRYEEYPKQDETRFNLNRYLFGVSSLNDKAYGIDVTTWKSNPTTSQVGNHWDEIDNYIEAHFPTWQK